MLDVGEQQFLMLLLVLQPQRDQRASSACRSARRPTGRRQQTGHARIDIAAVGAHFRHGRPRQQATLGTRVLFADAVVIGIEQHAEAG
jgi:hypothetical protein